MTSVDAKGPSAKSLTGDQPPTAILWNRRRRAVSRATLSAVLAALALVSGACGSSKSSSQPAAQSHVDVSGVTLNIGNQAGYGSESLLQAAGLLNKLPFKVQWHDFTSGSPIVQALGAGAVDFGQVGDAPPVFGLAGAAGVKFVGAWKNTPNFVSILVPKSSPIQNVGQLKGKKVAVAQASNSLYDLLYELNRSKLSPKDVNIDYLQPAPGLAAFTSGAVDAWATWSPYIEKAEVDNGAKVIANSTSYEDDSFNLASQAALKDPAKNAAIKDLLSLLNQARLWANDHPQQWGGLWGQTTGYSPAVMGKAAADSDATPVPISPSVVSGEQQLVTTFSKAGLIPNAPDLKGFFYTGYNDLYQKS